MKWFTRKKSADLTAPQRAAPLTPWEGEDVDLDRYYAEAWLDLTVRQEFLAKELMLADADWRVDQTAGIIQFARADGAILTAPVQIIGSWNPLRELFTWAWDHPCVHLRVRAAAERTRWFGDRHRLMELTHRQIKTNEGEAWSLVAVALKVNAAAGAYRGPTDSGAHVFVTFGPPKFVA